MATFNQKYMNIVHRFSISQMNKGLSTPLVKPLAGSSSINIVGGIPEITGIGTTNGGVINVSNSSPPNASDTLRTTSATTAVWKGNSAEVNDLPLTGVVAGNYNMATIDVDAQGRVSDAVEIYSPSVSFNLTAGTNVVSISSQSNFYGRVRDGVQCSIDITLTLTSSPSVATFTLGGLPIAFTGTNDTFGTGMVIRNLDLVGAGQLSYCLVKVSGTNTLGFSLPFSTSPTADNLRITGDLAYKVADITL